MNRRAHGVNLDDGVALLTDEDFRLLFVDGRPDTRSALQGWLADDEQGAILFGGQIGMGKTTLLNEVLRAHLEAPVIRMRFDTDCIDATEGGYVLMLFGQVLGACLKYGVETDGCGVALEDFAPPWRVRLARHCGSSHQAAREYGNREQVTRLCRPDYA